MRTSAVVRLNRLGLRCKVLGQYERGRAYYRRALAMIGGDTGPNRAAVATLYHNLAGVEHGLGSFASAVVLARRGIAIQLARPDADRREVAADLIALAAILDAQHDAAAERCFLRGLRLLHPCRTGDGREIALGLGGLGALHVAGGRYRRGMRLLQRSITRAQAAAGGADPALAVTLNNFALACERLGRPKLAQSALDRALGILEPVLGPDHPSTVACRANATRMATRPEVPVRASRS